MGTQSSNHTSVDGCRPKLVAFSPAFCRKTLSRGRHSPPPPQTERWVSNSSIKIIGQSAAHMMYARQAIHVDMASVFALTTTTQCKPGVCSGTYIEEMQPFCKQTTLCRSTSRDPLLASDPQYSHIDQKGLSKKQATNADGAEESCLRQGCGC